jgi:hypothetical protein
LFGQDLQSSKQEISPAGDVAASIGSCSHYESGPEVLIAASSGFLVDLMDETRATKHASNETFTVSQVNLTYFLSWCDFDLDRIPRRMSL